MQQYSPKNQIFLTAQAAERGMPPISDVRSCKAWNAAGRSIIKGEKALRVWIPKRGKAIPADLSTMTEAQEREYFVRGPVFDISQTKPSTPKHDKQRNSILSEHRHEQAWTDYAAAIDAGDIPADLDFADWYELREDSILAAAGCPSNVGSSQYADYTIATDAGAIIAQVEHHDIYAPIGGGSQELDTEEETAPAVSDLPHCATTEEYMAYQAGFAAGQKEYQELPESTVRTMHAAMRQSLARPAVYPTGITGTDRAHMEGRCDAYGYYLRNRPPTLLSLVRTNIKQRRAKDAAAYECDCHLQAGYDTGYAEQYLDERDRLWRIYYDACEAESATEHALFALLKEDRIDYGRIQRIVFDFS